MSPPAAAAGVPAAPPRDGEWSLLRQHLRLGVVEDDRELARA